MRCAPQRPVQSRHPQADVETRGAVASAPLLVGLWGVLVHGAPPCQSPPAFVVHRCCQRGYLQAAARGVERCWTVVCCRRRSTRRPGVAECGGRGCQDRVSLGTRSLWTTVTATWGRFVSIGVRLPDLSCARRRSTKFEVLIITTIDVLCFVRCAVVCARSCRLLRCCSLTLRRQSGPAPPMVRTEMACWDPVAPPWTASGPRNQSCHCQPLTASPCTASWIAR
jgi:hypothetical protein